MTSLPHDVRTKPPVGRSHNNLTPGEDLAPAARSDRNLGSRHDGPRVLTETNAAVPAARQTLRDRRNITEQLPLSTSFPPTARPHIFHTHPAPDLEKDFPSAPIDIPIVQASHPLSTPLTGRVNSFPFGSFFPNNLDSPSEKTTGKGLTPSPDSPSQSSQSEREHFAFSPSSRRSMKFEHEGTSPRYVPSSPLSTAEPVQPVPASHRPNARPSSSSKHGRRQPAPLTLPSLPAFHPANYEIGNSSPHSARPASSPHGRQASEAQRQYQENQRELILNYTRNAVRNSGKAQIPQPSSPRLNPLGSPGPITPLNLEGQNDYFVSGARKGSTSASKGKERREMVERMIGLERERIRYPERVERHSPAVSPAGGPG
ncbi:MAG: hypothetical protein Q9205_005114 [Flavoplaca limonia]